VSVIHVTSFSCLSLQYLASGQVELMLFVVLVTCEGSKRFGLR